MENYGSPKHRRKSGKAEFCKRRGCSVTDKDGIESIRSPSETVIYTRQGTNRYLSSGDSEDSLMRISRSRLNKLAISDGDGLAKHKEDSITPFLDSDDDLSICDISDKHRKERRRLKTPPKYGNKKRSSRESFLHQQ